jgi:YesN/AraC family two-component response regulator
MKHVLLVDDDPAVRDSLLRALRHQCHDWHIITASNGKEAVRAAHATPIEVIVTDILMPDMDGSETVVAFRREFPAICIVAMSGGGLHVGTEPLDCARLPGGGGGTNTAT